MEIQQTRILVLARNFELSNQFYEQVLALPRLGNWSSENGRGALFQAGTVVIEVRGRTRGGEQGGRDEAYDYQGPDHKLKVELLVPSAEEAYQELIFRERNIPGGLRRDAEGFLAFETHDPDGVRIVFRESAS